MSGGSDTSAPLSGGAEASAAGTGSGSVVRATSVSDGISHVVETPLRASIAATGSFAADAGGVLTVEGSTRDSESTCSTTSCCSLTSDACCSASNRSKRLDLFSFR